MQLWSHVPLELDFSLFSTVTQIGFNRNNYRVPEFGFDGQSSSVQLIVQVLNGTLADGLTYSVRLTTQAYNRQDIPATGRFVLC